MFGLLGDKCYCQRCKPRVGCINPPLPDQQSCPYYNSTYRNRWLDIREFQRLKGLEEREFEEREHKERELKEHHFLESALRTMSTAMNDSEEYCYFRVKESIDSEPNDKINIIRFIRCPGNSDLEKLRTELWKQFGVPRDRRIFYITDDGINVSLDSKSEFDDVCKLARYSAVGNVDIPYLIVGSIHVPTTPTCSDNEEGSGTNDISCPNKESTSINDNPISSSTKCEKNDGSTSEPNPAVRSFSKNFLQVNWCIVGLFFVAALFYTFYSLRRAV